MLSDPPTGSGREGKGGEPRKREEEQKKEIHSPLSYSFQRRRRGVDSEGGKKGKGMVLKLNFHSSYRRREKRKGTLGKKGKEKEEKGKPSMWVLNVFVTPFLPFRSVKGKGRKKKKNFRKKKESGRCPTTLSVPAISPPSERGRKKKRRTGGKRGKKEKGEGTHQGALVKTTYSIVCIRSSIQLLHEGKKGGGDHNR